MKGGREVGGDLTKAGDITLREPLVIAALFLGLAIAVIVAVYSWLRVLEAWSEKDASGDYVFVRLLLAGAFTVLAALAWYVLAFVVRPFG
jgi:hypothetical protein